MRFKLSVPFLALSILLAALFPAAPAAAQLEPNAENAITCALIYSFLGDTGPAYDGLVAKAAWPQVDPALLSGEHQEEGAKALKMLANHLQRIAILIPEKPLSGLRKVGIRIEYDHPELKNMQYHPEADWLIEHGYDPQLVKKVHIPVAAELLSRGQMLKHPAVILHELAHMWFGDLVTMRWWDDLWLNESFAEWAAHWANVNATRYTDAWTTFANLRKAWAYRQDQLPSTHPIAADIPDLAAVEVNFDGITYAKGASVLKQLVAYVGLEEFLSGLRDYFRDHAFGNFYDLLLAVTLSPVMGDYLDMANGLSWAEPGAGWAGRSVRAQRIGWHADGTPHLGQPVGHLPCLVQQRRVVDHQRHHRL